MTRPENEARNFTFAGVPRCRPPRWRGGQTFGLGARSAASCVPCHPLSPQHLSVEVRRRDGGVRGWPPGRGGAGAGHAGSGGAAPGVGAVVCPCVRRRCPSGVFHSGCEAFPWLGCQGETWGRPCGWGGPVRPPPFPIFPRANFSVKSRFFSRNFFFPHNWRTKTLTPRASKRPVLGNFQRFLVRKKCLATVKPLLSIARRPEDCFNFHFFLFWVWRVAPPPTAAIPAQRTEPALSSQAAVRAGPAPAGGRRPRRLRPPPAPPHQPLCSCVRGLVGAALSGWRPPTVVRMCWRAVVASNQRP